MYLLIHVDYENLLYSSSLYFFFSLALELVTMRSVNEMVEVLKKEVGKTHNTVEHEDTGK